MMSVETVENPNEKTDFKDGPVETATGRQSSEAPSSNPWGRPCNFVLLGTWFGLLTGFVEAGGCWCGYLLQRAPLPEVDHLLSVWMLPLAEVALFSAVGLVFSLLSWLCFGSRWLLAVAVSLAVPPFTVIVVYLGVILSVGLHPLARLLLVSGLAMRTGTFAANHPRGFHSLVLRTTPALIVLVGVLAASTLGWRSFAERGMVASLPSASADAPNVLLIVLDTVPAKSMSLYGYPRKTTANLERWAERSVVFEHAISPSPWTLPAHASMFTGRYPHEMSAGWYMPLSRDDRTLAEALYAHGYATAGFVANTYYCGRQTGLSRGFIHYEGQGMRLGDFVQYSLFGTAVAAAFRDVVGHYDVRWNRKSARQVNKSFLSWLSHRPKNRPFFVFLNYFDCHDSYLPRHPFGRPGSLYSSEERKKLAAHFSRIYFDKLPAEKNLTPEYLTWVQDAYDERLVELDRDIHALLTELDNRGELENTFVVITADHGEQFGEHGLICHSDSLYRPLLHVPLMVVPPKHTKRSRRVSHIVSLRDLPVTVLDLLGLDTADLAGESFADDVSQNSPVESLRSSPIFAAVTKGPNFPEWHPNSKGPVRSVWIDGMQYIKEFGTGTERLYDFTNDPEEEYDLLESGEYAQVLEECRQAVSEIDFLSK